MNLENFKQWVNAATVAEQDELAALAGTSRNYLHQLTTGKRKASAELAGRIEDAADEISKKSKGRLLKITRNDVCEACSLCPYAIKCTKKDD